MKISPAPLESQLPLPATGRWPDGVWDIEGFRHGTMSLVFFAPRGQDYQSPHDRDELYVILRGSGVFEVEDRRYPFGEGDVLFVEAGKPHRFRDFSENLAAWAIFYGPQGGERN
jgi:mannose-6-phosphate isomerase-like protein (cupin superfamily)